MTDREEFEAAYVAHLNESTGKAYRAEDMAALREGTDDSPYGDRAYLNGCWWGWQAALSRSQDVAWVAEPSVFEWLETEVTAIDCWYRGDPSYEHDAHWMKDKVLKLIGEAREAFAAPQPLQAGASARINLEGFRVRLLTPVVLARDGNGWFVHPEYPACDADMRIDKFLEAFDIEPAFVSMEDDAPEFSNRWAEEGLTNCSEWTPTPPEGNGWALLAICDSEDGPYAIYGRDSCAAATAPAEPKAEQPTIRFDGDEKYKPAEWTRAEWNVGRWLSAAMEDDSVCAEMKRDVNAWFAELGAREQRATTLTDEQIVRAGYMHTVETDEPLFQFDRKELIAMVRELLATNNGGKHE